MSRRYVEFARVRHYTPGYGAGGVGQSPVVQPEEQRKDIDCNNGGPESLADIHQVRSGRPNDEAAKWGEITIAQPKIWQFERVSAMLDGLLRDIEGVSLSDLTQLDPNQQNAAALTFIQQALEVGVQYDQAAAVNNHNILQSYDALHNSQVQQLDQYNTYMQTLTTERDRLASQSMAATNEVNTLQPLSDDGTISSEQATQLAAAISRQKATQNSLTQVNSLISGAGPAPTLTAPPTVTGTTVQGPASGSSMASSLSGFADVLKSLPSGVTNNLNTALQSPTYPATKRLDNFITLLYERLAREVSALQDDLTRDPENAAFLLQFDVGLYPSNKAKDHVARVEFNIDCPGCKVYSLYPGQSAYNIANYSGSSKRTTLWGNVSTLIGFGLSASYRRQRDTLQGSLVQSVYTAGFQNGVMDEDYRDNHHPVQPPAEEGDGSKAVPKHPKHKMPDSSRAEQSFGWYYGSAPFEKLVSPGIRSTFALITVPRTLIEGAQDGFGNTNACLALHINGGWASRNDPLAQDTYFSFLEEVGKGLRIPAYVPYKRDLHKAKEGWPPADSSSQRDEYDASVITKMTSVKLPAAPDDTPLVAKRERQRLHVLRMEYNTVYEDPPTSATTGGSAGTPASGAGATSGSATKAPAANASATTGETLPLDPLPCPRKECAAVLLRLDRPIDPNLAITVRGKPLSRVRDWRGRATSILPPVQSGSDITTPPGGTAKQSAELTSALLEAEKLAANTWFALNSHELILNVSKDVATDYDFPVIQIADPGGSVVIPHDLRRNVTELIVNGFRLKPLTERGIRTDIARNYLEDENPPALDAKNGPITTGPYPFSTYLPLFLPDPDGRNFFASVGETGEDLLVGFLPEHGDGKTRHPKKRYSWSEAHAQVILEDRDLDFAWSLSCFAQGDYLACHLPRTEISRAYFNFLAECVGPNQQSLCPAASAKRKSLSLAGIPAGAAKDEKRRADVQAQLGKGGAALLAWLTQFHENLGFDLSWLSHQFVSTMELWVEQSDPDGNDQFYSASPARIDYLPVSEDYWDSSPQFRHWSFGVADADRAEIKGCKHYPNGSDWPGAGSADTRNNVAITILGVRPVDEQRSITPPPTCSQADIGKPCRVSGDACGSFTIPTRYLNLTKDLLVFSMGFPDKKTPTTTVALPTSLLRPSFGQAEVHPVVADFVGSDGERVEVDSWKIYIPVSRTTCADDVELPDELTGAGVERQWLDGNQKLAVCAVQSGADRNSREYKRWEQGELASRVRLYLEIPRLALKYLPEKIEVTRTTSDGVKVTVAELNLMRLLLPSRLSLENLGGTQFVLRGENASVIDAVALQNGSKAYTIPTALGVDFALVTLPDQSSADKSGTNGSGGTEASTSTKIVTTNSNSATVELSTTTKTSPDSSKNGSAQAKGSDQTSGGGANGGGNSKTTNGNGSNSTPKGPGPGTYAVLPLVIVGCAIETIDANNVKTSQTQTDIKKCFGTAPKNSKIVPNYMPLDVKDYKDKRLFFTIPDPSKKASTTTASTTTLTCTAPCLAAPCTVSCTPTPSATTTPKTP